MIAKLTIESSSCVACQKGEQPSAIQTKIKDLFYTDQTQKAYKMIQSLGKRTDYFETCNNWDIDACLQCKTNLTSSGQSFEMALLSKEMNGIKNFMKEMTSISSKNSRKERAETGWTVHEDGPVDKILYKVIKGTKFHTTYIETQIKGSLSDIIAILMDVASYKQWMNMITHSEVLEQVSTFRKLAYVRADLPKPMSNRQLIVQASAHCIEGDTFGQNAVIVALNSINPAGSWLNQYQCPKAMTSKSSLVTLDI